MVEFEDIALFEKAFNGVLSAEENKLFSKRLNEDPKFKANYDKFVVVVQSIREQQNYEDLMVTLNECYKSRDWVAPGEPVVANSRGFLPWMIGLLVVLMAVLITFFIVRAMYAPNVTETAEIVDVPESDSDIPAAQSDIVPARDSVIDEPREEVPADVPHIWPNPTAFLISQNGYFLTAYEPISTVRSLRLRENDTTDYKAEIVLFDKGLNVAILRLTGEIWPREKRIPYRMATTQASPNTEVMIAGRGHRYESTVANIDALESEGSFELYDISVEEPFRFNGGPVVSRNGNIIALLTMNADSSAAFIKSTHLVGLLARNANESGMEDYLPSANNRLAGLEREAQFERMAPFVLEVIRFY